VERVKAHIAQVHVLRQSPNPKGVIEEAEKALAEAKQLGYAPVLADANIAVAIVHLVANHPKEANAALDDAIVAAEAGRHFRAKAQALAIGMELAYNAGDYASALAKDRLARAALAAIGGDDPLEADMEGVLGWIANKQNDSAKAEQHLRRAVELR